MLIKAPRTKQHSFMYEIRFDNPLMNIRRYSEKSIEIVYRRDADDKRR